MAKLTVLDTTVSYYSRKDEDYISLTDMARYRDAERVDYIIQNWMRNRNTIEFLGLWEQLNNPGFKSIEFDGFRSQAGLNSFALTPKLWVEKTAAVGIAALPSASRVMKAELHQPVGKKLAGQAPQGPGGRKMLPPASARTLYFC
jgi:hypothetical protein